MLRDADELLGPAVAETLAQLELSDADAAVVRLARQYARKIDEDGGSVEVLKDLGPKLLSCLESLGATPRARASLRKGGAGAVVQGRLAAIREAAGQ